MRDPEDLRRFARIDYAAIARIKAEYWRPDGYFRTHYGPALALQIADELRKQIIAQRPDWPTPEDRKKDQATHLRVQRLLERASAILRPRPAR